MTHSPYVHPINLSNNKCGTDLDNIDVVAIGNGATSRRANMPYDNLLRYADFTTMSSDECDNFLKKHNKTYSVICLEPKDGASVSRGDSGNVAILNTTLLPFFLIM